MTEVINPPPGDIVFASDGGVEVGRVIMRSGEPMHFVGNADEAARVFFDCFIALYSSEVQTLRSKLDGLTKERAQLKVDVGMHIENTDRMHDRAIDYMRERDAALLRLEACEQKLQSRAGTEAARETLLDQIPDAAVAKIQELQSRLDRCLNFIDRVSIDPDLNVGTRRAASEILKACVVERQTLK
jgi:hypothetical protein